jgi:hypothetical protein
VSDSALNAILQSAREGFVRAIRLYLGLLVNPRKALREFWSA